MQDLPVPASLDASERITIASGPHLAEFAPGGGGRLTRLSTHTHDWIVPLAATQ
ncbi:hypothetical protein [Achromobacter insolitus]